MIKLLRIQKHFRRFNRAVWPFVVLAGFFGVLVELAPRWIGAEAACAIYEPMSVRTAIILYLFLLMVVGIFLALFGPITKRSNSIKHCIHSALVQRPSHFITDTLGPIFGICIGLGIVAILFGYTRQGAGLLLASLYIPVMAALNVATEALIREPVIKEVSAYLEGVRPRLIGILLVFSAALLACLVLPIKLPNTGC